MLVLVLIVALAALGMLITGLITDVTFWAWGSIGLSVLAGVLLVVDWLVRRRKERAAAAERAAQSRPRKRVWDDEPDNEEPAVGGPPATAMFPAATEPVDDSATIETEAAIPDTETGTQETQEAATVGRQLDDPPDEEDTTVADLHVVSELDIDVVVVDEYPRYHLADCQWLLSRDTIPISVREARELGFTPCALCRPDATLAARQRSRQSGTR